MSISESITKQISSLVDIDQVNDQFPIQLYLFRLKDDSNNWIVDSLKEYEKEILSPINASDLEDLIEEIIKLQNQNPIIRDYLQSKSINNALLKVIEDLSQLPSQEIAEIFAYTVLLERLTSLLTQNLDLLNEIYLTTNKYSRGYLSVRSLNPLSWIKHKSIELSLLSTILSREEKPSSKLSFLLWFNIFEVALFEFMHGYLRNGMMGLRIANDWPKSSKVDIRQDLEIVHKNSLEWTNHYQVWDMVFTMQLKDFPLSTVKLLIPSVANYYDHPTTYMDNRLIALFLYTNYASFKHTIRKQFGYEYQINNKKSLIRSLSRFHSRYP